MCRNPDSGGCGRGSGRVPGRHDAALDQHVYEEVRIIIIIMPPKHKEITNEFCF